MKQVAIGIASLAVIATLAGCTNRENEERAMAAAQRSESATVRAEAAASRVEQAAMRAEAAAQRAESAVMKAEDAHESRGGRR